MSSVLVHSRFVFQPLMGVLVVAGGISIISPVSAATLVTSESSVVFFNFSNVADFTYTDAQSNTNSDQISDDAAVVATGEATAEFLAIGPAFSTTSSVVFGSGSTYSGTSNSLASLLGVFEANGLLFFDFSSTLQLQASIDDPQFEMAEALGSIGIQIEDITDPDSPILLDELMFSGRVSPGSNLSFFSDASSGFELAYDCAPAPSCLQMDRKKKEGFISAQFLGSYSRSFDQETTLRLSGITTNRATVQATAEPNPLPIPVLLLGVVGFVSSIVRRRQDRSLMV